ESAQQPGTRQIPRQPATRRPQWGNSSEEKEEMTVFRPGSRARKRTDCGHLRGFKPRSRRRRSALTFAGRWSRGFAVPVVRHRLKLAPTDVGGYPGLFNRRQEVKAKLPSRSCLSKGRNDDGERSQLSVVWTGARTFQSAATLVDLA